MLILLSDVFVSVGWSNNGQQKQTFPTVSTRHPRTWHLHGGQRLRLCSVVSICSRCTSKRHGMYVLCLCFVVCVSSLEISGRSRSLSSTNFVTCHNLTVTMLIAPVIMSEARVVVKGCCFVLHTLNIPI